MSVIDTYNNSEYNPNIEIVEQEEDRGPARMLFTDGICQSAVWLDPALRGEPVLKYARRLRDVVSREFPETPPKEVLIMGGAGLEIPRFLLRDAPEARITVVELDPVMKEIAEKHFFFDELSYGGRLTLILDNAVHYLEEAAAGKKKPAFDLIIDDAFCALRAETALLTDTSCSMIKDLLTDQGVYIINMVTALSGSDSWPLLMERDILLRFFETVRVYPAIPDQDQEKLQNCIVAARQLEEEKR